VQKSSKSKFIGNTISEICSGIPVAVILNDYPF